MPSLTNSILLITGGTGSLGRAIVDRLITTDIGEIRLLSRDTEKQTAMKRELQARWPEDAWKVKFFAGDIQNRKTLDDVMQGVDHLFHTAAMKLLPACELDPMEAVGININGTKNLLDAAIAAGVKTVVNLSSDKAVYPVSALGFSKAMMEKVAMAASRTVVSGKTKICCTRYGNLLCSQGSVIPFWVEQIKAGKPVTITAPTMTRFIMTLEEAVDLLLFAFEHGENGDMLVHKSSACTVQTQAEAVCELFGVDKSKIQIIGVRPGEKMYETLLTEEECAHAIDLESVYRVPSDGSRADSSLTEFTSNSAARMSVAQMKAKLLSIPYIQHELNVLGKSDLIPGQHSS